MKRLALLTLLAAGCGDLDVASLPSTFDGTFIVGLRPTAIECVPADAQVVISGSQITGTGMIGQAHTLSLTGEVTGSLAERTVAIEITAQSVQSPSYRIELSGIAIKVENGVSLTGNYTDRTQSCSGAFRSRPD